ncbi:hypothetical protein I2494_01130 [Budviciaceae bacterium BWR-B9]|uniref:Uncharacterized protein n=1 Tax=Limnobaculum allomyrinae TaxID=2791986 RepID=A0ABS1IKV2_9GAMM|nr:MULTISPECIES: hypothetical protein [Limnobaculum]MBK5142337.1 hypothetical protein [Limnobaculum allomyrinae]MBV7690778.1 hypothetical protein [Limnobaculum sp. M2-1]
MYTSTLPTMMRRSVFLTIYSILEFNTSKFCKGKIDAIQFPLKIDELNGRGMKRCIIFLEKILKLKNSETINRLNTMGIIRNFCIHNNGIIEKENKTKVSQLIKLSKGSLIIQDDTLVFNEGSIEFFIDIIRQFFNEIESTLNN